jgi:hypothetical protein
LRSEKPEAEDYTLLARSNQTTALFPAILAIFRGENLPEEVATRDHKVLRESLGEATA